MVLPCVHGATVANMGTGWDAVAWFTTGRRFVGCDGLQLNFFHTVRCVVGKVLDHSELRK